MLNNSATGGYILPNPPPGPQPLEDQALVDFFQTILVGLTGIQGALVRPSWQPTPPNPPDIATTWLALAITFDDADHFPYQVHSDAYAAFLVGGVMSPAQQAIAEWTGITNGGFTITANGFAAVNITGLDFSQATTLFDIANLIYGALLASGISAQIGWNGSQFVFSSTQSGNAANFLPLTAPTAGQDISEQLLCAVDTLDEIVAGQVINDTLIRHEEFSVLVSAYGPGADGAQASIRDGLSIAQNREALVAANMNIVSCGPRTALPTQINNQWYYRVDMTIRCRRQTIRTYPVLSLLSASTTILSADITETIEN